MKFLEKLADGAESLLVHLSKNYIGKNLSEYCDLDTIIPLTDEEIARDSDSQPYILVNNLKSLLTVYEIEGTFETYSANEFSTILNNLHSRLNGYFNRVGHSISITFERDPESAYQQLRLLSEPALQAAKMMDLQSEDIILDRIEKNSLYVAHEKNLLVVYTHLSVFSNDEIKREIKEKIKEAQELNLPKLTYGQNPAQILMSLKSRHDTFISRLEDDFKLCGEGSNSAIYLKKIPACDAIRHLRMMISRENTSENFRPVLLGDRLLAHGNEKNDDYSDLVPPKIKYQVCNTPLKFNGEIIETPLLFHGNLSIELGQQEITLFADLLNNIDKTMGWRVKFDLSPCGLSSMRTRRTLLSFVGMLPSNKEICESFEALDALSKDESICEMKITLSTWADNYHEVKRRVSILEKAVQAWGGCHVNGVHGDPLAIWSATVPAFSSNNIANRLIPPLSDALQLFPLQRPATPFTNGGNLLLRTPEGKIFPVELASRLQDTWIELISAPPGSGKSVFMNSMNLAAIHSAGNKRLPLMTIVDVGPSSSGLIQLIRDSLPENRKHEAICIRMQNSYEFAVNPWDTQLGCRYPTLKEHEFLVDFMVLLCTHSSTNKIPEGCPQICEMLLNIAYEEKADKSPNLYEKQVIPEIDSLLEELQIENTENLSWYEVTDILFKNNKIKEAGIAQRQASPILSDFSAYLNTPSIQQLFGESRLESGEHLISFMNRCFISAATNYAVFSGRTHFEINNETRIVAIDINDVIGNKTNEGKLRTTVMYLFARQLAAKNYFLRDELILPICPPIYRNYHLQRIANIQDEKKILAYDETHNVSGIEIFSQTMIKDAREGRKWGIRIINASQFLKDHASELLDSATSIFVMRGGNHSDELVLKEKFNISNHTIQRLQREAVGPTSTGGTFLAILKTKLGRVVQLLTNTVGSIEMWAFSTTLEDVALRNRMYKAIGAYNARKILAQRFPSGSALSHIEYLKKHTKDEHSVIDTLATKLINEFQKNK